MIRRSWLPAALLAMLALGFVGGVWVAPAGAPPRPAQLAVTTQPGLGCPAIPRQSPLPPEATAEQLESPDWRGRNAALDLQLAGVDRNRANIVFIGDSITQYFDEGLWRQFHGHRNAVNLGLWGDFTQGALWRLANGQWGEMQPRAAVILLGTNNTQWGGQPEDVAQGLAELVRFIQSRSPRTKVLIMGLLPRGATGTEPLRAQNARVNAMVERCADGVNTFYLDIGRLLTDRDGNLSEQVSFDRLHLTMAGYGIMAAAMEPTLRRMLEE